MCVACMTSFEFSRSVYVESISGGQINTLRIVYKDKIKKIGIINIETFVLKLRSLKNLHKLT